VRRKANMDQALGVLKSVKSYGGWRQTMRDCDKPGSRRREAGIVDSSAHPDAQNYPLSAPHLPVRPRPFNP